MARNISILSLVQGLQSVWGGRCLESKAAADVWGLCPGGRGAEAGAAHPEMQPGCAAYERDAKQPKISFSFCDITKRKKKTALIYEAHPSKNLEHCSCFLKVYQFSSIYPRNLCLQIWKCNVCDDTVESYLVHQTLLTLGWQWVANNFLLIQMLHVPLKLGMHRNENSWPKPNILNVAFALFHLFVLTGALGSFFICVLSFSS